MNNDDSAKTDVEMLMAQAWSSDELKKQQTSLTKTINSVVKHKGELSQFSSFEELNAIDDAIRTLHGFKQKVCHAKEKKARAERAEKRRREAVESKLKAVVIEHFESLSLYDQAVLCCSYPYSYHGVDEMLSALEEHGIKGLKAKVINTFQWNWLDKYMDRKAFAFSHPDEPGYKPIVPITTDNVIASIKEFNMAVPECRHGNLHEVCDMLKSTLSFSEQLSKAIQSA